MKTVNCYLANCMIGGGFGLFLYGIVVLSTQHDFKFKFTLAFILLGAMGGAILNHILKKKYKALYSSPKYDLLMIMFLQTNMFVCIVFGFFAGMLISWLFLFPYVLVFGHPETVKWTPTISYSYQILIVLTMVVTFILSVRISFKSGVNFLEKRKK